MKYKRVKRSQDPEPLSKRAWRPWVLRRPFLISFTILCIILCIAVELIVRGCTGGCYVFGEYSTVKHSSSTHFTYTQLPTVLSIVLSLLWALPNHNIMRLEPYFRMSAPGGATASDSIFLTYPYIFAPFVPFAAGKRRHYVVLISSCIALFINFLITPLISGIFNEQQDMFVHIPTTAARGTIRPGSGHNGNLSSSFTYVAYEYAWGNISLPAYASPTYALLPIINTTVMSNGSETWTAETTLFEADLVCEPAVVNSSIWESGISITNTSWGGSYHIPICSVFGPQNPPDPLEHLCGGFTTFLTPWTTIALPGNVTGVWTSEPQVYMFAFASGGGAPTPSSRGQPSPANITAIFCKSSYYTQPVTAELKMPEGRIVDVVRHGSRTLFSLPDLDGVVNAVDGALAAPAAAKDSGGEIVAFGYVPPLVPNVDSQLRKRLGVRPDNALFGESLYDRANVHDPSSHSAVFMANVHSISGLALAGWTKENVSELLDAGVLAGEYEKALQLWFALAVALEMVDVREGAVEEVMAERFVLTTGFEVDVLWARGVQGGLAAVAAMVLLLAVIVGRRPCKLDGEPNSLAEGMRLLAMSPEVGEEMENAEFYSPEEILGVFEAGKGRYMLDLGEHGPRVRAVGVQEHERLPAPADGNRKPWTEKLWPLRTASGVVFLFGLALVMALLTAAFAHSKLRDGLPTFAPVHSFWYKVLFTYLPIVVGMATEPVLLSIAICQSMLAPYKALEPGPATSSKSLALDYDRSPPHFQLFTSLPTGNIAIAALTTAILLSNVLAVTLAGLFSPSPGMFNVITEVPTYTTPLIQGTFTELAQEMYYILAEDLMNLTTTPAWTTNEYYVLPRAPIHRAGIQQYQVSTLGIGVDINCQIIPDIDIIQECAGSSTGCPAPQPGSNPGFNILKVHDPCWQSYTTKSRRGNTDHKWNDPTNDVIFQSLNCRDRIYAAWMERPADPEPKNGTLYQDRLEVLILKCSAVDKVVELDATVDGSDRVLSAVVTRRLDTMEVGALYNEDASTTLPADFVIAMLAGMASETLDAGSRHQMRWLNYLIATVDPRTVGKKTNITHIPDRAYIVGAFEDVYRRLFAINMALYHDGIIASREEEPNIKTTTAAVFQADRVRVSTEMFFLSVMILLFMVVVLVVLYWGQRQPVGHLPHSLAGTYALLYASNAKEECGTLRGRNSKERAKRLKEVERKYVYGPFDGGRHYGVYRVGDGLLGDENEV